MDPIGSEDEDDMIYKEEQPTEPEEPSEKIEKVIQHRTGPSWRELKKIKIVHFFIFKQF